MQKLLHFKIAGSLMKDKKNRTLLGCGREYN
jgi:hypothetical protein